MKTKNVVCLAGLSFMLAMVLALRADERGAQIGESDWTPHQRLSTGPGESRTTFNFARSIAADEAGRVHVVWHNTRDGKSQVYYLRSSDGGRTWAEEMRLSPETGSHEHPSITAAGDHVFVVCHGFEKDSRPSVYLRRSSDGGKTWEAPAVICDTGTAAHASVAAADNTIHLIWKDHRSGDEEVYYRRSTDSGKTFEPERRLTDVPFASYVPSLAASKQVVALAWVDTRDSNEEEYVKVSADGGRTWGPDTRLTTNRMNSWAPSVAVSGKTIHLVWFDQKHTPFHLYDAEAKLDEAMRLVGLQPEPAPAGVLVPDPEQAGKFRATEKMKKIQTEAPGWVAGGGDKAKLQAILKEFDDLGKPVALLAEAEKIIDEALALVGARSEKAQEAARGEPEAIQQRMQAKVRKVQQGAPRWVQGGGNPQTLHELMQQFEQALRRAEQTGAYVNKERKLDEVLHLMGIAFDPQLSDSVPRIFYGDALAIRMQQKQHQLQAAAPAWVQRGGDPQQVEALLREFEHRGKIATFEWDIYYRRSDDAGRTWSDEQRLVAVPGLSHRPHLAVADNRLHIVWWDNRDGNDEVYYKHSRDGDRTWSKDFRLTDTCGDSQFPMIAVARDVVHVVWTDRHDQNSAVFYTRRADAKAISPSTASGNAAPAPGRPDGGTERGSRNGDAASF